VTCVPSGEKCGLNSRAIPAVSRRASPPFHPNDPEVVSIFKNDFLLADRRVAEDLMVRLREAGQRENQNADCEERGT